MSGWPPLLFAHAPTCSLVRAGATLHVISADFRRTPVTMAFISWVRVHKQQGIKGDWMHGLRIAEETDCSCEVDSGIANRGIASIGGVGDLRLGP